MLGKRINLDHAATTPLLPEARAAMLEGFDRWANPSSPHADGRAARTALEDARDRIKATLGWDSELVFTSGATESAMLAMKRSAIRLVSAVEHDSVRRAAGDFAEIPVRTDGIADLSEVDIRPGSLVAIQHCNPETGVIQPLEELYPAVREAGAILLADCSQSAGKIPLPPADMIIVSAHKLGGPPGVGALLVRDFSLLAPTGGQERGYRGGTENLPAIMGFAAALEAWKEDVGCLESAAADRWLLTSRLEKHGATTICKDSHRSPYIAAYHMPGMSATAQLVRFDAMGFSVSAGSACSSGSMKPSHVLAALGLDPAIAANVIRVSFGKDTTDAEVKAFCQAWIELAREAQGRTETRAA